MSHPGYRWISVRFMAVSATRTVGIAQPMSIWRIGTHSFHLLAPHKTLYEVKMLFLPVLCGFQPHFARFGIADCHQATLCVVHHGSSPSCRGELFGTLLYAATNNVLRFGRSIPSGWKAAHFQAMKRPNPKASRLTSTLHLQAVRLACLSKAMFCVRKLFVYFHISLR